MKNRIVKFLRKCAISACAKEDVDCKLPYIVVKFKKGQEPEGYRKSCMTHRAMWICTACQKKDQTRMSALRFICGKREVDLETIESFGFKWINSFTEYKKLNDEDDEEQHESDIPEEPA